MLALIFRRFRRKVVNCNKPPESGGNGGMWPLSWRKSQPRLWSLPRILAVRRCDLSRSLSSHRRCPHFHLRRAFSPRVKIFSGPPGAWATDDRVPCGGKLAEAGGSVRGYEGLDALEIGRRDDQAGCGGSDIIEVILLHVVEDAAD